MSKKLINVDLTDMANGAIQEKLEHVMGEVLDNILNPNTDAKKKRKVTINLVLTPNENRDAVTLDAQVKPALVPEESATTTILVGRNGKGNIEANELKSGTKGQTYFDPDDEKLKDDKGEDIDKIEEQDNTVVDFQKPRKAGN